jgi:flagellar protein FliS
MTPTRYSAYQRAVTSTPKRKEDILLMLYDGVLKFVRFAKQGLRQKQMATKGENLSKALAILTELDCALDHQIGGDIATNLASLYHYIMLRLTYANLHNDLGAMEEVESLLLGLQQAFVTAAKQTMTGPVTVTEPTAPGGVNVAI